MEKKVCKSLILSLLIFVWAIVTYGEGLNVPSPLSPEEARRVYRILSSEHKKADDRNIDFFSLRGCAFDWKKAVWTEDMDHWCLSIPVIDRKHFYSVINDNWTNDLRSILSECHRYLYVSKDMKTVGVECRNRFIISDQDVDIPDFPTDAVRRSENPTLEILSEFDGRLSGLKSYQRGFISPKIESSDNLRATNARITNELHNILRLYVETGTRHDTGVVQFEKCPECHQWSYFTGIEVCFYCGFTEDKDAILYPEHDFYVSIPYTTAISHTDSLNVVLNELDEKTLYLNSGYGFGSRSITYYDQQELLSMASISNLDSLVRYGKTPVERSLAFSRLLDIGV